MRPAWLLVLGIAAVPAHAWAAGAAALTTPELLRSRIAATQDSIELDDATRARLVELYRQSLGNLEALHSHEQSAEQYVAAGRDAPAETERVRARTEQRRTTEAIADLTDLAGWSTPRLTRKLDAESANLTAVEARLAILEARLQRAVMRPAEIRARLAAARALLEDAAAQLDGGSRAGEAPQVLEAARWAAETRIESLRAEIVALDQELLSYNARNELLRAQRDEATLGVHRIQQRVELLQTAVQESRRAESEMALSQARAALAGASPAELLVRELAEANLALVGRLEDQQEELDRLSTLARGWPEVSQVEKAHRDARRKLDLVGSRAPIGESILAERRQLPSANQYLRARRDIDRSIVDVSFRLLELEEEQRRLADVGTYLDGRIEQGAGSGDAAARAELESLARTQLALLERALAGDTALQRRLYDLDNTLRQLIKGLAAYDEFLARRLLWVRSTRAVDGAAMARLPGELRAFLAPGEWVGAFRGAVAGLLRLPALVLVLLTFALTLARKRLGSAVARCGRSVGRLQEDSMILTLRALAGTVMLAAPVPLALMAVGTSLVTGSEPPAFSRALGHAFVRTAAWIALPVTVRALSAPGGVAERHFGWDADVLAALRRQLGWFLALVAPFYLVLRTSLDLKAPGSGAGALTFVCFVIILCGLVGLIVAVGHPGRGAASRPLASRSPAAQRRWRYLGFPLALLVPTTLGAVAGLGFAYTAQELGRRLFQTIWSLTAIWLGAALVHRWLLLTGRRLALQGPPPGAADVADPREHDRAAARPDAESRASGDELAALTADSRTLLNAFAVLATAFVLSWIWVRVTPALGILEDVALWSRTDLVDGSPLTVPVTMLDALLALVIGVGGYLLARNVPSLLDIILLKQGTVSAGGRYTARTLTRYILTAVTVLAVLQRLGANASQLGWAAAALGVGIGFGLQEIVANFICGLILLFERPVRVGDIVTIGDASGEVTRIRIRATTIRDWERKELVVPNKELITGRMLNWTLSNSVTRILVNVGVAYGSDVELAMTLIREAAEECPMVLRDPAPWVHFEQFGESSLILTLRAFTGDVADRLPATTEIHRSIDRKFRAAGVVIAFPQRDVHLHSGGTTPGPTVAGGKSTTGSESIPGGDTAPE